MNLTLRLSDRLIALQNMISIELAPSSESSDRFSIFIKGNGFTAETKAWCEDFNPLLFFMLFWDGNPTGQIEDVKAFYDRTLPLLSEESIDRFVSFKIK